MYPVFIVIALLFALIIAGLALWRLSDHRADRAAMNRLLASQAPDVDRFDLDMIATLPEPAQRYFRFSIAPGTPLRHVAHIRMSGQFGLGNKDQPRYMPMQAEQVLALPSGFVWKMRARAGMITLSGSDSDHWTRFWMAGLVPVGRAGGTADHTRSAFGRYAAEAVFWTPAALLPSDNIRWQAVDKDTARVSIQYGELEQSVNVRVDDEGRPVQVSFQRWSNANPDKAFRWQPFGGYMSEFKQFDGFTVPTRIEAGNMFGTPDYFAFFRIHIDAIHFPENRKD